MTQKDDLENCLEVLRKGGTILYPTDTVWGLGCDATNFDAIEILYKLKQRPSKKACVCLVSDTKMLERYVKGVPSAALDIIRFSEKPITIIYDNPLGISKNIIGEDNSIAIRVVSSGFCHQLISMLNKPLVSTSANYSGEPTPRHFKEISKQILESVEYAVHLHRDLSCDKPSTIIKLDNDNTINIIRK